MGRPDSNRPLPEVVSRTRNPVQRAFHAILSIAGWILFGWFWWTVFARPIDRTALYTFGLLLVALVAIVVIHLIWVRFNLDLYRTRGQRTQVRQVAFTATADCLGRTFEGADWDRLRRAASIEVTVDPERQTKRYSLPGDPSGGEPTPEPPLPIEGTLDLLQPAPGQATAGPSPLGPSTTVATVVPPQRRAESEGGPEA